MKAITENTGVSIGVILALAGSLVYGTAWAIRLEGQINVNSAKILAQDTKISEGKATNDVLITLVQEANIRLARIEGQLSRKKSE